MPVLTITKTYSNGNVLTETDLDNIKNSIETFVNVTMLDNTNVDSDSIGSNMTSVGANALAAVMTLTGADAIAATMSNVGATSIVTTMDAANYNSIVGGITSAGAANNVRLNLTKTVAATVSAGGLGFSTSSGTFSSSSPSTVDVTNLEIQITTNGRPVYLTLVGSGSTNNSSLEWDGDGSSAGNGAIISIVRNLSAGSTALANCELYAESASSNLGVKVIAVPPGSLNAMDPVAAGTYTYKVQCSTGGGETVRVTNCQLVAWELS